MSVEARDPSLLSRVPHDAQSVLVVGFERHPAANALAARTGTEVVCVEWYENAIAEARSVFKSVIAMPLGDTAVSLCSPPFDCIVITHLKGLSLSLPQVFELVEPLLAPNGVILFSVANPSYGPYSIIEHCQIGFTPVEVFDFAADAGLRLTARWNVVDPKLRGTRIDDTGHVTLFGERYRVESSQSLDDFIALEHHYSAIRIPSGTVPENASHANGSSLRSR